MNMYYVSYVSIGVIPRTLDFRQHYISPPAMAKLYIVPEPWRPRICRTPGHTPLLVRDARGCRLLGVSDLGHARSLHWVSGLVGLFVGWSCLLVIIGRGLLGPAGHLGVWPNNSSQTAPTSFPT
jgi:hypothetical protein